MNARSGAAALLAAAAAAAPAQASTARAMPAREAHLAMLMPMANGIQFSYDDQATFDQGLAESQRAAAYAVPATNTVHLLKGTKDRKLIAHEMGHLLDAQALTDADRDRFTRMLRAPATWKSSPSMSPGGSGAEWFADYYAAAVTGNYGQPRRRKDGVVVQSDSHGYTDVGPRRLQRFMRALDEIRTQRSLAQYQR